MLRYLEFRGIRHRTNDRSLSLRIKNVLLINKITQQKDAVYATAHYAFMVLTGRNISPDAADTISKLAEQDETVIFNYFKHRRNEIAREYPSRDR